MPKVIMGMPYSRNANVTQIPGRHQAPHRSVSEISEEIEATEVPAEAIAQAVCPWKGLSA